MRTRTIFVAALLLAASPLIAQNLQPAPDSGPTTFGGGTYSYDPAGNIIAIDNQYFLYDTTGRLTQASVMAPDRSMVTQSYTYDVYGNLLTLARTGVTQTMTVDITNNHLMNGSVDYDYDPAGNLLSWTPPGTSTTYQYGWDGLGNLQSIRLANQPVTDPPAVAYLYTASDERISTFDVPNQASHWMIRDLGGQVLTDFFDNQGTWSWTRDYFYRDGTMLASTLPNIVQHYTVDHLGSPRLITDDSANRIAAQTFLPFGEELQATFANGASIKKFTSHERDSDPGLTGTSLDYMHARYMNGLTGRFMSADPVQGDRRVPQSWNRYAYVRNSPQNSADPLGLYQCHVGNGDLRACMSLAQGFMNIDGIIGGLKPGDPRRAQLVAVRKAYGKEGDGNTKISDVWIDPKVRNPKTGQMEFLLGDNVLERVARQGNILFSFGNIQIKAIREGKDALLLMEGTVMHGGLHMLQLSAVNPSNPPSILSMVHNEFLAYSFEKMFFSLSGHADWIDPVAGAWGSVNHTCDSNQCQP